MSLHVWLSNCSGISVLLATVILEIQDVFGNFRRVRALIDSGSQVTFIVDNLVLQLGLSINTSNVPIIGIENSTSATSHGTTRCHLRPLASVSPSVILDAIVLSNICSQLLSVAVDPETIHHIGNVTLAYTSWNISGKIDLLFGADILKHEILHGNKSKPPAINIIFRWVLVGPINSVTPVGVNSFFMSAEPFSNTILNFFLGK